MKLWWNAVGKAVFDFPAKAKGYSQLLKALKQSGKQIVERFEAVGETPQSRDKLRHIIAIERWSANRLKVLLGDQPFKRDENHAYKPSDRTPWSILLEGFRTARAETLALAARIEQAKPKGSVEHNGLGAFSDKGWLAYIAWHAQLETRKLRS